jgi:hypothetical protein
MPRLRSKTNEIGTEFKNQSFLYRAVFDQQRRGRL